MSRLLLADELCKFGQGLKGWGIEHHPVLSTFVNDHASGCRQLNDCLFVH